MQERKYSIHWSRVKLFGFFINDAITFLSTPKLPLDHLACCLKYSDKSECDLFSSWSTRNETKKNIIQPATIENDIFFCENTNTIDNINKKEIINFLDINIQSEYRESYLRLKHGTKIPQHQLEKLKLHIAKIMEDSQWKNINHQENEDS